MILMVIMTANNVHAQIEKGHYSLEIVESFSSKSVFSSDNNESLRSAPRELFKKYLFVSLDVFDNKKAYFSIERSFDTGNTLNTQFGDYIVDLIQTETNIYTVKDPRIDMKLEVKQNGDVEIFTYGRIEHVDSKGIFNRLQNSFVYENYTYVLKRRCSDSGTQTLPQKTKLESFLHLGINHGAYKMFENKVVWEDITKWSSKEEIRELEGVDIRSFEVCHHANDFYLILKASTQTFPTIYTDYAKDKKHVYYQGMIMQDVNPDEFQVLDPLYARARENIFWQNTVIFDADAETFESINGGYAIDKNNFYFKGQVVKKDKNITKLLKEKEEKRSGSQ